MKKPPNFWLTLSTPTIGFLRVVGATPGGAEAQLSMHAEPTYWHRTGANLTVLLLLLHLAGAVKHEWFDREPTLMRMTIAFGQRRSA
jgi:cytochrome b561